MLSFHACTTMQYLNVEFNLFYFFAILCLNLTNSFYMNYTRYVFMSHKISTLCKVNFRQLFLDNKMTEIKTFDFD